MSEMTTLEAIRAARQLLSDESAWLQGELCAVRTECGREWSLNGWGAVLGGSVFDHASCFCAVGALMKVTGEGHWGPLTLRAESEIGLTLIGMGIDGSVPDFNDDPYTTHAQLMTVLDKTIERLEAQPC